MYNIVHDWRWKNFLPSFSYPFLIVLDWFYFSFPPSLTFWGKGCLYVLSDAAVPHRLRLFSLETFHKMAVCEITLTFSSFFFSFEDEINFHPKKNKCLEIRLPYVTMMLKWQSPQKLLWTKREFFPIGNILLFPRDQKSLTTTTTNTYHEALQYLRHMRWPRNWVHELMNQWEAVLYVILIPISIWNSPQMYF